MATIVLVHSSFRNKGLIVNVDGHSLKTGKLRFPGHHPSMLRKGEQATYYAVDFEPSGLHYTYITSRGVSAIPVWVGSLERDKANALAAQLPGGTIIGPS